MSLTVTVTRGWTMYPEARPTVADWNALGLPTVTITGGVGTSDIADDAITFDQLNPNFILGGTEVTAIASLDKLLVGVAGSSDNRVITFQNVLRSVHTESAERTAFADMPSDSVVYWEGDDRLPVRMTLSRFIEQLMSQPTELTTTDQDDSVLVLEASETDGIQVKRVTLRNLLPNAIVAQTVNNPTQIVVDAKGRVTAISGTEGTNRFTATGSLPTLDGYTNGTSVTINPSFGAVASSVTLDLVCLSADLDYAAGDVVPTYKAVIQTNSHPAFTVHRDATDTMKVCRANGTVLMYRKDGASASAIDTTKWGFQLMAWK